MFYIFSMHAFKHLLEKKNVFNSQLCNKYVKHIYFNLNYKIKTCQIWV